MTALEDLACLTCLRPVHGGGRHHPRCARRLFGSNVQPRLDLTAAQFQTLALATIGRSSLAGVQRKISVGVLKDRSTLRIEVDGVGRFILKPASATLDQLPENEHVSMTLAKMFGLIVPPHTLVEMGDGSLAYLVARFDRPPGGGKRRQEDLCQLRLLPPSAKYEATALDCAGTIQEYSAEPAADLVTLFETFVFTHWIGNGDHHLKNISLLAGADGRHLLSPIYDQVCTAAYPRLDTRPALPLLDHGVTHVRPGDWTTLAEACRVRPRALKRILSRPRALLPAALALVSRSQLRGDIRDAYLRVLELRTSDLDASLAAAEGIGPGRAATRGAGPA